MVTLQYTITHEHPRGPAYMAKGEGAKEVATYEMITQDTSFSVYFYGFLRACRTKECTCVANSIFYMYMVVFFSYDHF